MSSENKSESAPTLPAFGATPDTVVESYWVLGDLYRFLLPGKKAGAPSTTVEVISYPAPAGSHPPFHCHKNEDEEFFILEGKMNFLVGDNPEPQVFGAGSYLWQPRGTKHTFWPADNKRARFLAQLRPPGLEDLFREIGTKADLPGGVIPDTPVPPSEDQLKTFAERAADFGITIFPPSS